MKGSIHGVGISKRVNVLSEPSAEQLKEGARFSAVPAYTYASPGSTRVQVMIKNLTARAITVGKGQVVAEIKPANAIPKMLAPKVVEEATESAPGGDERGTPAKDSPQEPSPESEENPPSDPIPRAKLTESQMAELHEKLELEKHTEGWSEQLKRIMDEYGFLFALDSLDLGKTDVVKHHIELSDYTPIKDRYRQIPPHQYDEVHKHLQEMLAVGAIRKSNSPWASPVVLVQKKDGSLRFCIDLRKLNSRTIKDVYSLPRIEDALDSLDGACLFTSLDLKSGYWQVELDEESIPLTAFTVGPLGFYDCVRMPFGLTNAPATFQRLMQTCLGELHLNWCIIYLDDIIIFSKTPEEHLCRLKGMFERLAKAGLKLKPSKCEFFHDSLRYLGHVVSPKGIATNPKKIEAIQ